MARSELNSLSKHSLAAIFHYLWGMAAQCPDYYDKEAWIELQRRIQNLQRGKGDKNDVTIP